MQIDWFPQQRGKWLKYKVMNNAGQAEDMLLLHRKNNIILNLDFRKRFTAKRENYVTWQRKGKEMSEDDATEIHR